MKTASSKGSIRRWLAAALAIAVMLPVSTASAWYGPWGPAVTGWDPQEAWMEEYGYLDRFGPTLADIRRLNRDQWRTAMGYPVRVGGIGPYGPTRSDVIRQHNRKMRRAWGYSY
jgi:hypothetical protein